MHRRCSSSGSLFFTCFLFVWTFVYAIPFVIACAVLPFPRRYALVRLYGGSVLWVLKWSCGLTYTIEGGRFRRARTWRCGSIPPRGKPWR